MKKLFRYKIFYIIIFVTFVGGFLRLYHAGEWMHYELDQARDYRVIHTAIERGPSYLPLQGPKAAGNVTIAQGDTPGYGGKTTLRLGPLFYYIEYVSAVIFGDTPLGSVMLIILISIATIPLFYFFARELFLQKVAYSITMLFAVSLFFVTYSRFGWNPNLIPFFTLGTFYALLRATRYKESHAHTRGWWLILASISFAFLSQMHFLALIVIGAIAMVYLLLLRPKIPWRYWGGALAVFVFLSTPLIINDVKTGGENSRAFIASLTDAQKTTHTLQEKIAKNASQHIQYYWIVITGNQNVSFPVLKDSNIFCDDRCKDGLLHGVAALSMMIAGWIGVWWMYKKLPAGQRRHALLLILLWAVVPFIIYIPLAYDFAPRFFLVQAPVAILFVGLIMQMAYMRGKKYDVMLTMAMIVILICSNLFAIAQYFYALAHVQDNTHPIVAVNDRILGEKTRMTLEQLNNIANYMAAVYRTNSFPLFIHGQSEFKRALWERIDRQGIARDHIPKDFIPLYREGNYFLVLRTQADQQKHLAKYAPAFTIREKKAFGTLTLYHLIPRAEAITAQRAQIDMRYHDPRFSESAQPRYLWHQVFSGCQYDYTTDTCVTR